MINTTLHSLQWKQLYWKSIEKRVLKLQTQIFNSRRENNTQKMHKLQRLLIELPEAKLLAIKRVTQDNRGKNTPGVDGVSSISPEQRFKLLRDLRIDGEASPIKRVYIPKPLQPGEQRPLGIPTIKDRAKQALSLMALEPEWEANFEPNSYGFRPGRSCHDAIEAIHLSINKRAKYVLDADIAKCFDRIKHEALISKMATFSRMERQIQAWLKAGIMEHGETLFPIEGTPQGGVISPLLANIALHGLETHLKEWVATISFRDPKGKILNLKDRKSRLNLIRYADDFVVCHPELWVILEAKKKVTEWLQPMGLEIKESKTKICHTFLFHDSNPPGFDFLGFHIRQYSVGKPHQGKKGLPYKTLIKPSKQAISKHLLSVKKVLKETSKLELLVLTLNPIIRGWAYYYRTVASTSTFSRCDKLVMEKLMMWAKRKHSTRSGNWVYNCYLRRINNRLRFGFEKDKKWLYITLYTDVKIQRHVKVSAIRSPYDLDWSYWVSRNQRMFTHVPKVEYLLKLQKGKCTICGLYLAPKDLMEIDHKIPRRYGGENKWQNLQLVHGHCHDQKTAREKRERTQGAV
jgi:RNA-directed DNA polymerase